jgi:hypothetical protein
VASVRGLPVGSSHPQAEGAKAILPMDSNPVLRVPVTLSVSLRYSDEGCGQPWRSSGRVSASCARNAPACSRGSAFGADLRCVPSFNWIYQTTCMTGWPR